MIVERTIAAGRMSSIADVHLMDINADISIMGKGRLINKLNGNGIDRDLMQ